MLLFIWNDIPESIHRVQNCLQDPNMSFKDAASGHWKYALLANGELNFKDELEERGKCLENYHEMPSVLKWIMLYT
ncbi:hypothetical protein DPMN_080097 [Dreissena polymorpha]|uniref:Uncharacterized protein n=1 Tax=Dreissena polymorpha TaxID=45954 RepID=A0A9D4BQN9_DREPO|nr:hypothetical protein DPMN_080096 [Dreissena polymorpha]KAH3705034.1 hypothetical protein DPMN_080097 [Dreissena polymorpha]